MWEKEALERSVPRLSGPNLTETDISSWAFRWSQSTLVILFIIAIVAQEGQILVSCADEDEQ